MHSWLTHRCARRIATCLLTMLAATCVSAAELTPEQKQALILRPEHYDVMHGKIDRISLNGWWKFKRELNVLQREAGKLVCPEEARTCPETDPGLERGYQRPDYDAAGWDEILVPKKSWNQPVLEREREPFAGLGYYRTSFRVPADRKGKRVFLCFTSVQTQCRAWVNGKPAGTHENHAAAAGKPWSFLQRLWLDTFEFDITELVTTVGPNTLVLRVFDHGLPVTSGTIPDDGGIAGPAYVEFRESVHAPAILVAPELKTSTVKLAVTLENYTTSPRKARLAATFAPFQSRYYTPPATPKPSHVALGTVTLPPGTSEHRFTVPLTNPVLWDTHRPFLYHLRILADENTVGQARFGFREFTVVGKQFHLNGHPIYLPGINPSGQFAPDTLKAFNHANWLRFGLRLMKNANVTLIRVHTGPETQIYYDICDELGLISEDDYSPDYRELKKEHIKRAEHIEDVQVDSLLGADNRLSPETEGLVCRWVAWLHNHPSVCMLTAGNELGLRGGKKEGAVAAYMNAFYDCVKANDLQQRPITPSSGLLVWQWKIPVKADFHDYHRYAYSRAGWPDSVYRNWGSYDHLKRIYSEITKPVINGECVGAGTRRTGRRDIRALFDEAGQLDKAKYVAWANKVSSSEEPARAEWDGRLYVRFSGVRSVPRTATRSQTTAQMNTRMVRMFRRDMDWLEGFVLHDIRPIHYVRAIGPDRSEQDWQAVYDRAAAHLEVQALRRAFAPHFATLDMYDRNQFAGTELKTDLYVMNNLYKSAGAELVATVSLENAQGKALHTQRIRFPNVLEHVRLRKSIIVPLAAELPTADYVIRTVLTRDGTPVHEQAAPLALLGRPDAQPAVRSAKRIALHEPTENGRALAHILAKLRLRHKALSDFGRLSQYDVLLIGPNSLDQPVVEAATPIRDWLRRGGQLVCFVQERQGPIPFLKTLRCDRGEYFAADRHFADAIERTHPVLKGLAPHHWELWNGGRRRDEDGVLRADTRAVYDSLILPITHGVIVAAATGPRWGKRSPTFGMIVAEEHVGRGRVFLSQALAVKRYDTDSVARRYVDNVLRYTLGDKWPVSYTGK